MKRLVIIFSLIAGISAFQNAAQAQNISVNINIGSQPAWGPVGYDYVDYYYFPDIDCYYGINTGLFHFRQSGRWIASRYLPVAYSHYDLYHLYKVVLNVNEPWRYHHHHYRDYARYKGHRTQIVIRDSPDRRNYKSRNNNIVWYNNKHADKHFEKNFNKNHKPGKWENDNRNGNKNRNNDFNRNNSKKDYNKKGSNLRSSRSDKDSRQNSRISSGRSGDNNKSSRSSSRSSSQNRSQSDRSSRSM